MSLKFHIRTEHSLQWRMSRIKKTLKYQNPELFKSPTIYLHLFFFTFDLVFREIWTSAQRIKLHKSPFLNVYNKVSKVKNFLRVREFFFSLFYDFRVNCYFQLCMCVSKKNRILIWRFRNTKNCWKIIKRFITAISRN